MAENLEENTVSFGRVWGGKLSQSVSQPASTSGVPVLNTMLRDGKIYFNKTQSLLSRSSWNHSGQLTCKHKNIAV